MGFDFFHILKGIILSTWETKSIKTGGTNLTNDNYAKTGNQLKFIDTLKCFQTSLTNFALAINQNEKE